MNPNPGIPPSPLTPLPQGERGDWRDDELAVLLEAFDDALRDGKSAPEPSANGSSPAIRPRLEAGLACLRQLNQLRPRNRATLPAAASDVLFGQTNEATWVPDARTGSKLGKYVLTRRLGQGGMGVVYEAEDLLLHRKVAVKLLSESLSSDAKFLQRFLQEGQAAARLNHPNVVSIFELDQHEGTAYIVMEMLPGGSAQDGLQAGKCFAWPQATRMIADACRGLAAAHAAGLIHRDIKPANLLCTIDGMVKLADFGLARKTDCSVGLTVPGMVVGTPYFMSPEQCRSEKLDARSDIYSLGACYYALLVGHPPDWKEGSLGRLPTRCETAACDPRVENDAIPKECAAIIQRAMAKDPGQRFANAQDMLSELEDISAGKTPKTPQVLFPNDPSQPAPENVFYDGLPLTPTPLPQGERGDSETRLPDNSHDRGSMSSSIWTRLIRPGLLMVGMIAILAIAVFSYHNLRPTARTRWILPMDGPVWTVTFSPDDRFLAAANGRHGVRLWDYSGKEPKVRTVLWTGEAFQSLAFSADSELLAAAGENGVRFWRADNGPVPALGAGDDASKIRVVAFSPSGRKLAAAVHSADTVAVNVWDLNDAGQTLGPQWNLQGNWSTVSALAFSPDGRLLAAAGDMCVRVWVLETGALFKDLQVPSAARCLTFCKNDDEAVFHLYAGTETTSHCWDCDVWQEYSWPSPSLNSLAAAGTLYATSFSEMIMIQQIPGGRNTFYHEHQGEVYTLAFSANGHLLASGSADQTLKLLDTSALQK